MAKSLLTIGYEGSAIADFLATLQEAKIDAVIDVRDVPVSRKAGFSKNALAQALEATGISYIHLKQLGDPKEGRDAARLGNHDEFRRIYTARLQTPEAKVELKVAIETASAARACLLCYERDPKNCHRSLVAKCMSNKAEFRVTHLGVRDGIAERSKRILQDDAPSTTRKVRYG
jgi:uncharacterized protein (DUF488 family)